MARPCVWAAQAEPDQERVGLLTKAWNWQEELAALHGPDRAASRALEAALKAFFAVRSSLLPTLTIPRRHREERY